MDHVSTRAFLRFLIKHHVGTARSTSPELATMLRVRPGRWFGYREIADVVYAAREDGGPELTETVISVMVSKLRAAGCPIEGQHSRGYRWVPEKEIV